MINNISFTQNFSFFDIEKDNFMIKEEKNKNIKNLNAFLKIISKNNKILKREHDMYFLYL
ncbi:hypothetical protein PFAG_01867 [Plasmodium falciparum Santa Lucia]|uniref:Uncharacterized protein n=2 Tax=Plasmodium falciparum TaxID=5833 RepID=A0A024XAV0_PLAFC|nr:hypothetical protein PFMC_01886 [Plasmodium falciparum CAMP/Malaysia]EUT87964.1 hypothetical protein PFAG_01867 [Plasmodium falciparum Santa Lucia]